MTDASILAYCRRLAAEIEATWQRIPISDQLKGSHPIPLKATLAEHEGPREAKTTRSLPSVEAAIEAALEGSNATVIFGGPGAGKSVALKWAARQYARKVIDSGLSPETPVPVYVDLGLHKERESLDDLLEGERKRVRAIDAEVPVTWFLDGLDLLLESGKFTARDLLHQIPRSEGRAKESFVLSTRPMGSVDSALSEWATSERITLSTLSRTDRKTWVDDHCPSAKAALATFEKEHGDVAGFLDTPLLFAMVLSACLDEGKVFKCDEYPGKAGLFHGFVSYALDRAVADKRIKRNKRMNLDTRALEGVFWAAVISGEEERITTSRLQGFLTRAFGHGADSFRQKWTASVGVLIEAGLLEFRQDEWRVLHQQFAEYWASCHLARRLEGGYESGWFGAELWDHFMDRRLDPVVGQALAVIWREKGNAPLDQALESIAVCSRSQVLAFVSEIGGSYSLNRLRAMLTDDQASIRGGAARALGTSRALEAVDWLDKTLADPDENVRHTAADALASLGSPDAVNALVEAFQNADHITRCHVASALGVVSAAEAIKALVQGLEDPYAQVRATAAGALRKSHDAGVAAALVKALDDKDENVRFEAASALAETGRTEGLPVLMRALGHSDSAVWMNALHALTKCDDPQVIELLVEAIEGGDQNLSFFAAEVLANSPTRAALTALIQMLPHLNAELQVTAMTALAHSLRPEALSAIVEMLKSSDEVTRMSAVLSLAFPTALLPSRDIARAVIKTLEDPSPMVRQGAVMVLRTFPRTEALGALTKALSDPNDQVRFAAAVALGHLGSAKAEPLLMNWLTDPSEITRFMAACALAHAGNSKGLEIISRALESSVDYVRSEGLCALAKLGAPEAVGHLMWALQHTDPSVRARAISSLSELGAKEPVGPLVKFLADETADGYTCEKVAQALGKLGTEEAVESLVKLLADKTTGSRARGLAAEALAELGRDKPAAFCLDISLRARQAGCSYESVLDVAVRLNRRIEPWDLENELAEQRKKREEAQRIKEGQSVTILNDPVFNQCIVNIESNLNKTIQRIGGDRGKEESELRKLLAELKEKLQSVPVEKAEEAEAVLRHAENLTAEAAKPRPNKNILKTTARMMVEATQTVAALATLTPITQEIARIVLAWCGK